MSRYCNLMLPTIGIAIVFAALAHSVVQGQEAASGFKQENRPENLKALCQELHKAITANNVKRAASLTRGLLPDESRVRKALHDKVPSATVDQIMALHKKFTTGDDASLARLLAAKPENTEVQVHGATTEELRAYAKDSVAYKEFPGGAQRLAAQVLRPGMTFYEVEFVPPGKDLGMKFHLFYWDGSQWTMLGPVWRVIK
jgi:hypothetical protein